MFQLSGLEPAVSCFHAKGVTASATLLLKKAIGEMAHAQDPRQQWVKEPNDIEWKDKVLKK